MYRRRGNTETNAGKSPSDIFVRVRSLQRPIDAWNLDANSVGLSQAETRGCETIWGWERIHWDFRVLLGGFLWPCVA